MLSKKITFALSFVFLLYKMPVSAQDAASLQFESITINDGLSQGYVSCIAQDRKGLIWITTSDGLNRYDGSQIIIYHHDPEDTTSIAEDDLSCVFEDSKGRLWVGTRSHGLDLFDRENEVFQHLKHDGINSIRSNNIIKITEDKSGAIWIETRSGLDRLIIDDNNNYDFTHIRLDTEFESNRINYLAEKVFIDSHNRILITTNNTIWELLNDSIEGTYKVLPRFRFEEGENTLVPQLQEDTIRNFIYLNNRDIIQFSGLDFDKPRIIFKSEINQPTWTIDMAGRIWFSHKKEIMQHNPLSGEVRSVNSLDPSQITVLQTPTYFFNDRTGVVWVASGGYGILKFNPQTELFHHVLPGSNMYQILETTPATLITRTLDAITLNEDHSFSVAKIAGYKQLEMQFPYGLLESPFAKDSSGNIWVSMPNSIYLHNLTSGRGKKYPIPYPDTDAVPFPLYMDSQNKLWMGFRKYLLRFDPVSGKFSRFAYPDKGAMFDNDYLQCIFEDGNHLWLGSKNGLFQFDIKTETMIHHYINRQGNGHSLSNDYVISLAGDVRFPQKYIWVGTKGGGLNRLNKITGTFSQYTIKDGLPNNTIYGILPDDQGNLWISTNNGLSKFNPISGVVRNFDVFDGLQGNEFNRYAYYKTSEGMMVFGGLNGLNYFDPKEIEPLQPLEVMITGFRLFNKPVNFKNPDSPIKKNISYVNSIVLRYAQNVVTFSFAGIDFRRKKGLIYRYMMKGFDKTWYYAGYENEATYTNLDPGEYKFIVQSKFKNGSWDTNAKSISLLIIPPWHRTLWFYALIVASTISVSYAFYRYRLNQLIRLTSLRNRIARDLHDEVGSSISTIAIYSKMVYEQSDNEAFNNKKILKKITEHASEIMESMNDIVWNINTKNDAFDNIIIKMREHAYQLFEAKGYTLHFNFDEDLSNMRMDMERRRHFYLIYKEGLNNIVKYAEGKNIWITVLVSNQNIHMTIKDDGQGFDQGLVQKKSNGLNNMHYRAEVLKGKLKVISVIGVGTQLDLDF